MLVDDTMKTRAVVLNGNLYLTYNSIVDRNEEDPAGQYAWLEQTLQQARENQEQVGIYSARCNLDGQKVRPIINYIGVFAKSISPVSIRERTRADFLRCQSYLLVI